MGRQGNNESFAKSGENANALDDEKFLAAAAAPTLALPAVCSFVRVGICSPARSRRPQHRGKATTIVARTRGRHPRRGSDYALAVYGGLRYPGLRCFAALNFR